MPYVKSTASSLDDLLSKIAIWATDTTIHGTDAWTLMRNEAWPRGTIFKAKGLNGENTCYIGLMLLDITVGSSYKNWLLTTKNVGKHLVWSSKGLNLPGTTFVHTEGSGTIQIYSSATARTTYTFGFLENATDNGTMLVFGVFKDYAEALDWDEQPGAIEFGDLGAMPITVYSSATETTTKKTAPIYPGVGYPGIAFPAAEPADGYFSYWLTKDANHITVVTNNAGQWDMGHAGMLIPFQSNMQYPFPAVVAGTCTGLTTTTTTINSAVVKGSKLRFSYSNYSNSRRLPCSATFGASANTSQVGLCLADGTWAFFGNWTQALATYGTSRYLPGPPVRSSAPAYAIKPTYSDLLNVSTGLASEDAVLMEPLQLVEGSTNTNLLGSLWRMYWPGASQPFGEITINAKACLLIPDCWEDRLWYVPDSTLVPTTADSALAAYKSLIAYGKQFRMLIRLEE